MSGHTSNDKLRQWVDDWAAILQPDDVHWCDGSAEEYAQLCADLVAAGTFTALDAEKRPNSFWAHSDPADVARVEDRTFICSRAREPTPGRRTTGATRRRCAASSNELYTGAMRGRTMYVVPFSMGPLGSPIAHIGVQLTDSAYVAASMRIMTRMGQGALDVLGDDGEFVPCVHSVGAPLADGRSRRAVAVQRRQQVHRPLPRDPRDHVVRLGLRRQRPARQEVLRPAHRLGDGARRRLARRAHADPQAHQPGRASRSTSPPPSRRRAARPTWR